MMYITIYISVILQYFFRKFLSQESTFEPQKDNLFDTWYQLFKWIVICWYVDYLFRERYISTHALAPHSAKSWSKILSCALYTLICRRLYAVVHISVCNSVRVCVRTKRLEPNYIRDLESSLVFHCHQNSIYNSMIVVRSPDYSTIR